MFRLAKEVPEDVDRKRPAAAARRRRSRDEAWLAIWLLDRVLFDAALGLAGFDKEFELKVRSTAHLTTLSLSLFCFRDRLGSFATRLYSAPYHELRCCQCVAWFFQGARRTLDFLDTSAKHWEPSP